MRSATPAPRAFSCASAMRSGSMSTHRARAELRRGDYYAPVAAAQVVDHVAGLHRRELGHRLHHWNRRGLEAHARRAGLRLGEAPIECEQHERWK
jgi:hypothetical protein